jgi:hypothetical protein
VLLHFERTTKPFTKCDDVISLVKKKGLSDYVKAKNLFEILLPNMKEGISNSEWVVEQNRSEIKSGKKVYELSSYCNIHDLIRYLYSLIH